jgi:hypothetical protein
MVDKKRKLYEFFFDDSIRMSVLVKRKTMIRFIENALGMPFQFLLKKNIYQFLKDNADKVKMARMLTKEEEELFDKFLENWEKIKKVIDTYEEKTRVPTGKKEIDPEEVFDFSKESLRGENNDN